MNEKYMKEALKEAKKAYDKDEIGLLSSNDCLRLVENSQLYQFDSRAFVIPNNEIINYFSSMPKILTLQTYFDSIYY